MIDSAPEANNFVHRRIHLVIFRHDEKGKTPPEGDQATPLTLNGKVHAYESAGKLELPNPQRVITSVRRRVVETALLKLAKVNGLLEDEIADIPVNDLLVQADHALQKLMTDGLGVLATRRMVYHDDRLNFNYEGNKTYEAAFYEVYGQKENNRTLLWQLKESDNLVLELAKHATQEEKEGLKKVSTYKRLAGDMAEMIHRYLKGLDKLKNVRKDEPFDLDILMGTHSQNLECFLMRLIERKEGREGLDKFLKELPSLKGFVDFSEGIDVDISEVETDENPQKKHLRISFRGKSWDVTPEDLETMIYERDVYNAQVSAVLQL